MNEYSIEDLCSDNKEDWEEFNRISKEGSFFHTLKWKNILEKSFNLKSRYFLVYQGEKVISICPFYENTIKGFKGLFSLPESDHSTIIIDRQNVNRSVIEVILNKAKDLSKMDKLSFILISTLHEDIKELFNEFTLLDYPTRGNMVLDLEKNSTDKIWNEVFTKLGKGIPRKYIRRFENAEFNIEEVKSLNQLKVFYKYYSKNLEYKNVEAYPFFHFDELWNNFSSKEMRITLLQKDGKIFGGLLTFLFPTKDTIYLRYLALNRDIPNTYHPVYYLYWDAILYAAEMKYKKICFGGTPHDSNNINYRVKMKFGSVFEEEHLVIFPLSMTFKTLYKAYKIVKR